MAGTSRNTEVTPTEECGCFTYRRTLRTSIQSRRLSHASRPGYVPIVKRVLVEMEQGLDSHPYEVLWEAVFIAVTLDKVEGWFRDCGYL